jgi:hypothetical protein
LADLTVSYGTFLTGWIVKDWFTLAAGAVFVISYEIRESR